MTVLHSQSKSRMSLYLSVNDKLSVMTRFMKCPPDEWVYWFVVVLVGNIWALFFSGGELSPVGSCPRTNSVTLTLLDRWVIVKARRADAPETVTSGSAGPIATDSWVSTAGIQGS